MVTNMRSYIERHALTVRAICSVVVALAFGIFIRNIIAADTATRIWLKENTNGIVTVIVGTLGLYGVLTTGRRSAMVSEHHNSFEEMDGYRQESKDLRIEVNTLHAENTKLFDSDIARRREVEAVTVALAAEKSARLSDKAAADNAMSEHLREYVALKLSSAAEIADLRKQVAVLKDHVDRLMKAKAPAPRQTRKRVVTDTTTTTTEAPKP